MTSAQTARLKRRFLDHFRVVGNLTRAAELAGVKERRRVYDWKADDLEFAAAYAEAEQEAVERLEDAARHRATEGLLRKKFTKSGEPIIDPETGAQYVERQYSDTLLIVLLKAHAPEKYRDKMDIEHSGKRGGAPIPLSVRAEDLSAAQLDTLIDLSEQLGSGGAVTS
jgi:hypothetical protein